MPGTGPQPIEIAPGDAKALLERREDALLLDCRTPQEHAAAKIAGAVLIPKQEIADRLAELAAHRAKPIVVFCHGGMRSLSVAQHLRREGFTGAMSMAGGIDRWSVEIDPSVPRY